MSLPDGIYDLTIAGPWFYNVTIKAVHVHGTEVRVLPLVRMAAVPFCTGHESSPDYYLVPDLPEETGRITGIVNGETGPVPHAIVTLRAHGMKAAVSNTDENGRFSFAGLKRGDGYWLDISAGEHFDEELTNVSVQAGLDAHYTAGLEACLPGRCQPHLKTVRVLLPCL